MAGYGETSRKKQGRKSSSGTQMLSVDRPRRNAFIQCDIICSPWGRSRRKRPQSCNRGRRAL